VTAAGGEKGGENQKEEGVSNERRKKSIHGVA